MIRAKATGTTETFGRRDGGYGRLPVHEGAPPWEYEDDRIVLEDGTVCYSSEMECEYLALCTEMVALDAGDNEIRRYKAADRNLDGITRPAIPGTSVNLVAAPETESVVGYYRVIR
jgi:hypothetical protein